MSRHRNIRGIADEAEYEIYGDFDDDYYDDDDYDDAPVVKAKPKPKPKKAPAAPKPKEVLSPPEPKPSTSQTIVTTQPKKIHEVVAPVKPSLNLVVAGHVDHGKSTIVGHLLVLLGRVSEKTIRQLENHSKATGKSSFSYAWVFDQQESERARGVTIDVGHNWFETANRVVTVLDCPGHRDFIPNMLSGASQADAALLVVSALEGEFEAGFGQGQTREHAVLLRAMGVTNLIVVINKMESTNTPYDQARYTYIKDTIQEFLIKIGFAAEHLRFAPLSGYTGINLHPRIFLPEELQWYKGPTLVDLINDLPAPERSHEGPLRMVITDVNNTMTLGLTVTGKVNSGMLQKKQNLVLMPANIACSVRGLEVFDQSVEYAVNGDSVSVGIKVADPEVLHAGMVLCTSPVVPCKQLFRARIVTIQTNKQTPILPGAMFTLHMYNTTYQCHVKTILSVMTGADSLAGTETSGGRVVTKARVIPSGATAEVIVQVVKPICMETFDTCQALGRFSLRKDTDAVAVGIILELLDM